MRKCYALHHYKDTFYYSINVLNTLELMKIEARVRKKERNYSTETLVRICIINDVVLYNLGVFKFRKFSYIKLQEAQYLYPKGLKSYYTF